MSSFPLSSTSAERRRAVERKLHALDRPKRPRLAPPPDGRLGTDERPIAGLRAALEELGPVFSDFGRYLSSRIDLLPRRDCIELAATDGRATTRPLPDAAALAIAQLGDGPGRRFFAIDPAPLAVTHWEQRHEAWLASGEAVVITLVRPDAGEMLASDLPLLRLLVPWLDAPEAAVAAAIDDFSDTLQRRIDERQQASAFTRLFDDAQAGGTLDAPRCYADYCAPGIVTLERIDGIGIASAVEGDGTSPGAETIDRERVAHDLASAWVRQAVAGRVVPFEFDLRDLRLREGRLVLVGGLLEPVTAAEGAEFLRYLVATAADEPDRALAWITSATGNTGEPAGLRRRLRQAVPFRDGEWSGEDRLAEQLLVHWRAVREAGAAMLPHHLRMYRGVRAVSAATMQLAGEHDALLAGLQAERLRQGLNDAQALFESRTPVVLDRLLPDIVDLPRRLDEILTQAADGRLRVKVHMPEADERHEARNRTVSLVASLVALVGIAFLVRHLAPAYGGGIETAGAALVLILGAWLLVAASRL